MSVLLPSTLKARATLIVFTVFILSHLATLFIFEKYRDDTVLLTEATDLADRIIGIVDLANSFADEDRQRILAAAETQFLAMFPASEPLTSLDCDENQFAQNITQRLDTAFDNMPGVDTEVCVRDLTGKAASAGQINTENGVDVLIYIDFPDGHRTVFHAVLPEGGSLFQDSVMTSMLMASLLALLLAWYLIAKTVAPLGRLARAADSIGTNIDNPALDERGPLEVTIAARAFNRMQSRLARLIHGQTELLAAISHDLRSAVTRLQLRVEMLHDPAERNGMTKVVEDMRRMIQSVIDFSRGLNPNEPYRKVNIAALVDSLCEDLYSEGLPVSTHGNNRMDTHLYCRVTDVRRALQNVIDNAITYAGAVQVSYRTTEDSVVITVEDDGPGVPEDQLAAILRPFYRLETSRNTDTGGIGLGLSITHSIVHSHGGEVFLANRASGGLRVELVFPLVSEARAG